MNPEVNLYELLEVSPMASPAVIKAAYRCLAQLNHPDRHAGTPAAVERQALINAAYAVLSKPDRRLRYDQRLGLRKKEFVERRSGTCATESDHGTGGTPAITRAFAFRPLA
ncbi:MAG: J domain-containing protein [Pseudomonadota bacterium]